MYELLRTREYLPDPVLPLEVRHAVLSQETEPHHSHEFMEMALVVGGSAIHVCDGVSRPVHRGDIFVIDTRREHHYARPDDLSLYVMLYDEAFFLSFAPSLGYLSGFHGFFHLEPLTRAGFGIDGTIHLPEQAAAEAERLLREIRREKLERRDGYSLKCTTLFTSLLVDLSRRFAADRTPVATWLTRVGDIVTLLRYQYQRTWALDELARRAGMSVSTLLRQFRRATGTTPAQYQLGIRLARAATLLTETPRTVSEIALETGFSGGSYLARAFRARHGCSPLGFRRERNVATPPRPPSRCPPSG